MPRTAVIGAGSWGTAVAALAAHNSPTVLWARRTELAETIRTSRVNRDYLPDYQLPKGLSATSSLEEALDGAEVVVMGVPSHGFREILDEAKPFLASGTPIVSLTKGVEQETLKRMTEVIADVVPEHPCGVLTGPNLAKEIMAGQAAASVIATEDLSVAAALQAVLRRGVFRIYMNHDVIGCEVAGALKNVIAIAAGIAQGVSVGDNTRAAVISRGVAELTRLGVAMGGEAPTFAGLAGMGDLIATCVSPQSRNRYVGEQLGLGRPLGEILAEMNMVAEGVKTAVTVMQLAERHDVEMPICHVINRVVTGEMRAVDAYRGLRPAGHELDPG